MLSEQSLPPDRRSLPDRGPVCASPNLECSPLLSGATSGSDWSGDTSDTDDNIMAVARTRAAKAGQVAETRIAMPSSEDGIRYVTEMECLLSPLGTPCTAPPWAKPTAVDMSPGRIRWEIPLGSIEKLAPGSWKLGAPRAGGPLLAAGDLALIGCTPDEKFRAFGVATGEIEGRQFIVMPAGGHGMYGSTQADPVVAHKLKH